MAPNTVCISCDARCSQDGCIGRTNSLSDCLGACAVAEHGGACVDECPAADIAAGFPGYFIDQRNPGRPICRPCSSLCEGGCHGPRASQCIRCADAQLGTECVASCPMGYYKDGTRMCASCHQQCRGDGHCSGPLPHDCEYCSTLFDTTAAACVSSCGSDQFVLAPATKRPATMGECVTRCPPTKPYYPARRYATRFDGRHCVASCTDLNDTTIGHSPNDEPYACTSYDEAGSSTTGSDDNIDWALPVIVLAIIVATIVIGLLIAIFTRKSRGKPDLFVSHQLNGQSPHVYASPSTGPYQAAGFEGPLPPRTVFTSPYVHGQHVAPQMRPDLDNQSTAL